LLDRGELRPRIDHDPAPDQATPASDLIRVRVLGLRFGIGLRRLGLRFGRGYPLGQHAKHAVIRILLAPERCQLSGEREDLSLDLRCRREE
jgi:hypothetical protein